MNTECDRFVFALTGALLMFAVLAMMAALLGGCTAGESDDCDALALVAAAPAATKGGSSSRNSRPSWTKPRTAPTATASKPKKHRHGVGVGVDLCDD